jgi:cell division protein ZapE
MTQKITLDSQQIIVQKKLQQLGKELENKASESFLRIFFSSKNQQKSLYIYGDVGRGKSMLMKNFFDEIEKTAKIYFHFNGFMRLIHEALRDIRLEEKKFPDELIEAVKRVVGPKKLLCFDEFQVTDIADAMLLGRIFAFLFSKNVIVVFTSNSHPLELYKNGLQREIFVEFVNKTLLKNCEVLHLNSETDYRAQYRKNLTQRYFLQSIEAENKVAEIIQNLTLEKDFAPKILKVWGREIEVKKTYEKIAIFDFDELCRVNLSASDYQTICQNFELIFLLKVPKLTAEDVNEARRFVLFIDEIYENKVALITLAVTKPAEIYVNGIGHEAFKRTVSRLNEIESDFYWQNSKVNF